MLELLAIALTLARLASAQDMTAEVTSAPSDNAPSDSDLLAYTTITTACLPDVDSNNEPIFSIQTNTDIASCTYVVNADNTAQVVSTIGAAPTATPADTASDSVPSTMMGITSVTMADPTAPTDNTIPTDSSDTGSDSSVPDTTVPETSTEGIVDPSATAEPTETPTGLAASRFALGGEVLGFAGVVAVLVAL